MKRVLCLVVALIFVVGILAGCRTSTGSNTSAQTTTASSPETKKAAEPVKLTVAIPGDTYAKVLPEVFADYNKIKSNVTVEYLNPGHKDYSTWLLTQYAGGNPPDIISNNTTVDLTFGKGWIVALDDYLAKPSPYAKDAATWMDTFFSNQMPLLVAPDGKTYGVPVDLVATGIMYNKDLFAKAGITSVPKTWGEFLQALGKLKAIGVVPFAMSNEKVVPSWVQQVVSGMLLDAEIKAADKDGNGRIDNIELAKAVVDGIFAPDKPAMKEVWKVMKDFSQYWEPGFVGSSLSTGTNMFLNQQAAMIWRTNFDYPAILNNPDRKFQLGVMFMPKITKADNPFSVDKEPDFLGGPSSTVLTVSAASKHIPEAIDLVQYMTSKDVVSKLCKAGMTLPGVKGVEVDPELKLFVVDTSRPRAVDLTSPSGDVMNEWWSAFCIYMSTNTSYEEATKKYYDTLMKWAKDTISKNK